MRGRANRVAVLVAVAVGLLLPTILFGTGRHRVAPSPSPALSDIDIRPAGPTAHGDPSELARGKLLIAGRNLIDPNFSKTVVLLVRYGPHGALGLIINRPTPMKLAAILPDLEGPGRRTEIYVGGPVSRDSMAILVRSDAVPEQAQEVAKEIHFSQSRPLLDRLAAQEEATFRAYVGYAGWAPGQLDNEVERGDWYIVPAEARTVFDESPLDLWRQLVPGDPTRSASLR